MNPEAAPLCYHFPQQQGRKSLGKSLSISNTVEFGEQIKDGTMQVRKEEKKHPERQDSNSKIWDYALFGELRQGTDSLQVEMDGLMKDVYASCTDSSATITANRQRILQLMGRHNRIKASLKDMRPNIKDEESLQAGLMKDLEMSVAPLQVWHDSLMGFDDDNASEENIKKQDNMNIPAAESFPVPGSPDLVVTPPALTSLKGKAPDQADLDTTEQQAPTKMQPSSHAATSVGQDGPPSLSQTTESPGITPYYFLLMASAQSRQMAIREQNRRELTERPRQSHLKNRKASPTTTKGGKTSRSLEQAIRRGGPRTPSGLSAKGMDVPATRPVVLGSSQRSAPRPGLKDIGNNNNSSASKGTTSPAARSRSLQQRKPVDAENITPFHKRSASSQGFRTLRCSVLKEDERQKRNFGSPVMV
eukprot:gene7751-1388_t